MILLVGGICIDFLYWLAGRAYSDNSVRDILGNNAACADNDIAADSNAGHNANVAAYPHIAADLYRLCVFKTAVACFCVKGMTCRVETAVRPDENVVAEDHLSAVEYKRSCD